ncbi:MAG: beta-glucosidase [Treponematales bacterium]
MTKHLSFYSTFLVALIFILLSGCTVTQDIAQPDPLTQNITQPDSLTNDELQLIDNYLEDVNEDNFRDYVGQLFMVGLPTDYDRYSREYDKIKGGKNNKDDVTVIRKLIQDIGIGWVFLNSDNYHWERKWDEDTERKNNVFNNIQQFYNQVQELPYEKDNKAKLPVGFAANFEDSVHSSISNIVMQPVEALSLTASVDPDTVYYTGQMVGQQFHKIGVHLLLGPVLDLANYPKDKPFNRVIRARSFGTSEEIVSNVARHYITAVRSNNVFVIAKHFPGYNLVEDDTKTAALPTSWAEHQDFENSLFPYRDLAPIIDGIMTAHIKIDRLPADQNKEVTFSKAMITGIVRNDKSEFDGKPINGLNMKDQIVITDDLGDEGPMKDYINKNENIDWESIVVRAFNAGHDILLFSVIERKIEDINDNNKKTRNKKIDIATIEFIINKFSDHVIDDFGLERFKESLRRVLILKARIAKTREQAQTVKDFLSGNKQSSWDINLKVTDIGSKASIQTGKKNDNTIDIKQADDIVENSLLKAYIKIGRNASPDKWSLENKDSMSKFCFFLNRTAFGGEKEYTNFKTNIHTRFTNTNIENDFVDLSLSDGTGYETVFARLGDALKNNTYERVYFVLPYDGNSFGWLYDAFTDYPYEMQSKMVVLLHTTPTMIRTFWYQRGRSTNDYQTIEEKVWRFFNDVTIIGCLSAHPLSYTLDYKILVGDKKMSEKARLPIDLLPYSADPIYTVLPSDFQAFSNKPQEFIPSDIAAARQYWEKNQELEQENERLKKENDGLKDTIKKRNSEPRTNPDNYKNDKFYPFSMGKIIYFCLLLLSCIVCIIVYKAVKPIIQQTFFRLGWFVFALLILEIIWAVLLSMVSMDFKIDWIINPHGAFIKGSIILVIVCFFFSLLFLVNCQI